jgi:hypothetical protein
MSSGGDDKAWRGSAIDTFSCIRDNTTWLEDNMAGVLFDKICAARRTADADG